MNALTAEALQEQYARVGRARCWHVIKWTPAEVPKMSIPTLCGEPTNDSRLCPIHGGKA